MSLLTEPPAPHILALQTQNLQVGYAEKVIVADLNIRLHPGQILCLIGPNGSGKSTILKSLARQLPLISGEAWLWDKALKSWSNAQLAQGLSILSTKRPRTEKMTCQEIIASGRSPYTGRLGLLSAADYQMVDRAIELLSLEDLAAQNFMQISDGQKQRVLLARAICQEPDLIILDEPTAFLDIRYKLDLVGILRQLAQDTGVAMLISLHELDLAQSLGDEFLCLKQQRVLAYGSQSEVFKADLIKELYSLEQAYNPLFNNFEQIPRGDKPQVFVMGGGGQAIALYRKLQRQAIPFASGILHKNDLDYYLAQDIAQEVIAAEAFQPISQETVEKAKQVVASCPYFVNTLPPAYFATINAGNRELLDWAQGRTEILDPQISEQTLASLIKG